jgi:hypothetical protein
VLWPARACACAPKRSPHHPPASPRNLKHS